MANRRGESRHTEEAQLPKRTYSNGDRSEMVRILAESGGNLSEAARRTGWPRKTIEYVARHLGVRESAQEPAFSGTDGGQKPRRGTDEDRERAIAGWQTARTLSLAELADPEKVKKATLKDNGVIAGIAQDKLNILTGGVTARGELNMKISLVEPGGLRAMAGNIIDGVEGASAALPVRSSSGLPVLAGEFTSSADADQADARIHD